MITKYNIVGTANKVDCPDISAKSQKLFAAGKSIFSTLLFYQTTFCVGKLNQTFPKVEYTDIYLVFFCKN